MKKEALTLNAIKGDLMKVVNNQIHNKSEWRHSYIIPITALAIMLGIILKNIFIGLLIFSFSIYQIVQYIIEIKELRSSKKELLSLIERGEISISNEVLSHIATETIYEPHPVFKRTRMTKDIRVYHFSSGSSWRVPIVDKHYSWSKELYLSRRGLENISIAGDEFFMIRLQRNSDIAYIYPRKIFELDESLKRQ